MGIGNIIKYIKDVRTATNQSGNTSYESSDKETPLNLKQIIEAAFEKVCPITKLSTNYISSNSR